MKIIFFDTETTGNTDSDRLCQLAVKGRGITEPILNSIYKPPLPISIEAMAIHHITKKMVIDRPSFIESEEYKTIKNLFEEKDIIAVAHNATFDVGMLAREGIFPKKVICTYKVASALDPNDLIPTYKLQYLRYLLDLDVDAVAHDAFGDVVVLEGVFDRLLKKLNKEEKNEEKALEEMVAISERPMLFTTLRFGKYKGKRLKEIAEKDSGYLQWLLGQKKLETPTETDWIYTLEYYLGENGTKDNKI